jgi:hypothetical protein
VRGTYASVGIAVSIFAERNYAACIIRENVFSKYSSKAIIYDIIAGICVWKPKLEIGIFKLPL